MCWLKKVDINLSLFNYCLLSYISLFTLNPSWLLTHESLVLGWRQCLDSECWQEIFPPLVLLGLFQVLQVGTYSVQHSMTNVDSVMVVCFTVNCMFSYIVGKCYCLNFKPVFGI